MWAALPEHAVATLVTGEACVVLLFDRVGGICGEAHRNCFLAAARVNVRFTWTMTAFAPQLFVIIFRMSKRFAHDRRLEMLALRFVTGHADFAAHVVTGGCWRGGRTNFLLLR